MPYLLYIFRCTCTNIKYVFCCITGIEWSPLSASQEGASLPSSKLRRLVVLGCTRSLGCMIPDDTWYILFCHVMQFHPIECRLCVCVQVCAILCVCVCLHMRMFLKDDRWLRGLVWDSWVLRCVKHNEGDLTSKGFLFYGAAHPEIFREHAECTGFILGHHP